jgi:hypothetical protein
MADFFAGFGGQLTPDYPSSKALFFLAKLRAINYSKSQPILGRLILGFGFS